MYMYMNIESSNKNNKDFRLTYTTVRPLHFVDDSLGVIRTITTTTISIGQLLEHPSNFHTSKIICRTFYFKSCCGYAHWFRLPHHTAFTTQNHIYSSIRRLRFIHTHTHTYCTLNHIITHERMPLIQCEATLNDLNYRIITQKITFVFPFFEILAKSITKRYIIYSLFCWAIYCYQHLYHIHIDCRHDVRFGSCACQRGKMSLAVNIQHDNVWICGYFPLHSFYSFAIIWLN